MKKLIRSDIKAHKEKEKEKAKAKKGGDEMSGNKSLPPQQMEGSIKETVPD